ncbi:MAG: HD domain-containing phosphohydrolase [Gemmatimonadota bacterium]
MKSMADLTRPALAKEEPLDALISAGRRAEREGEWTEAENAYLRACELIEAGEQADRGPQVLRWLGRVYFERGDYDRANTVLETSLAAAHRLGLRNDAASALNSMAVVAQFRGQLDVAEVLYERAATIAAELDDPRLSAMVDQNLGMIANIRGDLSTALMRYQGALERFRVLKDDRSCGWVLSNMGMLHVDVGEWAAAELCFNASFQYAERTGDLPQQGRIENNRADLHMKRQQYEDARAACERAFRIFSRLESDSGLGSVHRFYGILYRETGKSQMAHMHFTLSLQLARACDNPLLEAEIESERARLFVNERNHRHALRSLNRAHRIFLELDARREILDLRRRLDRMQDVYLEALRLWNEDDPGEADGAGRRGRRVAEYAVRLAQELGVSDAHWLRVGAYLHDIGNSDLPEDVLAKNGPLSQEEWELVRKHPILGAQIIADLEFPPEVAPMVRNHHEHWDGTGYPDALRENDIPVTARIMCIADVFDALTSPRSYRPAFSVREALDIMHKEAGSIIDPDMFITFRALIEREAK